MSYKPAVPALLLAISLTTLLSACKEEPAVTLCYRRPRRLPAWPYNLFCMIHGRERAEVEGIIADLRRRHGLEDCAHDILFSLTRFKQNGARYA